METTKEQTEVTMNERPVDLNDTSYYNNRELSWLNFNLRVLEEAIDERNPFLERLKFLAIYGSNLDEFFMVRVASLLDQVKAGYNLPENKAGMTPLQQLAAISDVLHEHVPLQSDTYLKEIVPGLREKDIHILALDELTEAEFSLLEAEFDEHIFPVLTPMVIDAHRPFPKLLNKSLNLAIIVGNKSYKEKGQFPHIAEEKLAIVQVPSVLDRFLELPAEGHTRKFVLLEDVIGHFIYKLFRGFKVKSITPFRITRNADLTLHEEEAQDLLTEIEEEIRKRQWGAAVRLEIQGPCQNEGVVDFLIDELAVKKEHVYFHEAPLDLTFLFRFYDALKKTHPTSTYKPFSPQVPQDLQDGKTVFDAALERDILLHHPYESFDPVVQLISEAADDPNVLAIKQTLYRVSGNSPIIKSLKRAAENGKQVTVLLELKARFDEENNVQWAKELEKAGCHVIYGIIYLKTHSKISLIVRRRNNKIERFVHLGTGNYNDATARFYTDLGLITTNEEIGEDATNFFNHLSGYMKKPKYNHLIISPFDIREEFIQLIDQEMAFHKEHGNGHIVAKMNSLSDKDLIVKLYEASRAGVKIDLIVRGICCLRPGIPGISENITVRSIVGRFLEHTRIYAFHHNGEQRVYLSSADMMTRNMSRRVEILFPILKKELSERIIDWLDLIWSDNVKAREQAPDGSYFYVEPKKGDKLVNSQEVLCERAKQNAKGSPAIAALRNNPF
ncbi:RNA degradosome polyphosphate kinase [Planococcaceae bacterium Storch 2/2-2]|nr:RNA degradosome polyphosphate kinase [Planococcaceae bacterium Storch 2/2-2]